MNQYSLSPSAILIDFGSGKKKRRGHITVDISATFEPDIVHDLNKYPYPFPDSYADGIVMDNVIEHLDSVLKTMDELYRISKDGSTIELVVPYFRSLWAFIDPTHKNFFTTKSLSYFDPDSDLYKQYRYSESKFSVLSIIFNEGAKHGILKSLLVSFANRFPTYYEYKLSHLFPLDEITFRLKCIKQTT